MKKNIWKKLWPRLKKSADSSASFEPVEDEEDDALPESVVVTDELDLHGAPISIIPEMIDEFLDNAVRLRMDSVQIIHGKGKSRLKHLVKKKRSSDARVIAFHDAPPQFGGWGRTIVELRKSNEDKM